ncbi:MAG: von Willebrand factor type A domain-containing protein [Oscillospiraceae bacterium]|nr:von Willebrand factor type A domain-containing protein [Oscillospiraceae bacterium]
MKTIAKIAAAATVAALIGTAATGVFAKTDDNIQSSSSYTTPMTTDRKSAEYKDFVDTKPNLSVSAGNWYSASLFWNKVKGAMLYYVYKDNKLIGSTTNTEYSFNVNEQGTYKIVAVTYDYNDARILSKSSNTVEYEYSAVYEDYDGTPMYKGRTFAATNAVSYAQTESVAGESYDAFVPYPSPYPYNANTEEYTHYDPNGFKKASDTPLSTFSADVDTASYANVRRMINSYYDSSDNYSGNKLTYFDVDSVRTEEFLNYFDYNYSLPEKNTFKITYELSDCPWNEDTQLLMLGVQAKDIAKEPDSNLVFLIDVSGSMSSQDKLPLVGDSLKQLSNEMSGDDRISIVTYSGAENVIVSGAKGNMKNCIGDIADSLIASGCTNGEKGINMAYDIAEDNFIKDGNNRVIMATDGDLNVGITDKDELSRFIEKKRDTGVYLTVLGVGTGNLKDNKMEALAKDGNGNYYYIDCVDEAQKVLVDERKSTLFTVADDVKFQVEFNPEVVESYRLIGYEGRRLENEDFENDAKDAADVGAGQSVSVMYEIIPAKASADTLKYQKSAGNKTDVCTLKIRYKKPSEKKSLLSKVTVTADKYLPYKDTGIRFRFATCVAETAMALRGDTQYGKVSIDNAKKRFDALTKDELSYIGYSDDFGKLIEKAAKMKVSVEKTDITLDDLC